MQSIVKKPELDLIRAFRTKDGRELTVGSSISAFMRNNIVSPETHKMEHPDNWLEPLARKNPRLRVRFTYNIKINFKAHDDLKSLGIINSHSVKNNELIVYELDFVRQSIETEFGVSGVNFDVISIDSILTNPSPQGFLSVVPDTTTYTNTVPIENGDELLKASNGAIEVVHIPAEELDVIKKLIDTNAVKQPAKNAPKFSRIQQAREKTLADGVQISKKASEKFAYYLNQISKKGK